MARKKISIDTGPNIVLASGSPRRQELLSIIGVRCDIRPSHIDESVRDGEHPADYVMRLAESKAAHRVGEGEIVLGADTTVALLDADGWSILGKPNHADEARAMLRRLSGRSHKVFTGHAAALSTQRGIRTLGALGTSTVTFRDLSDAEIEDYATSAEPLDRAGGYAIQGGAAGFVASLEGSRSNVVGLDVELTQIVLDIAKGLAAGDRAAPASR